MSRQSITVLISLGLTSFAIGTDFTGLAAVLVPIERTFGTDLTDAQWALNVFVITFAMSIVAGGRLADMFGRRRIFFIGIAIFGLATLAGALSWNITSLIVARAFHGIGNGLVWPCVMGLCVSAAGEKKSSSAISLMVGAVAMGNVVAPMLSGVFVELATWRLFFVMNILIVTAAILIGARSIPADEPAKDAQQVDYAGTATLALAILALFYALDLVVQPTGSRLVVGGLLVVSLILFAVLAPVERRVKNPMLPPELMGNGQLRIAVVLNGLLTPAIFAQFVLIPHYAHIVLGWPVASSAFAMMPQVVTFALFSVLTGLIYEKIGSRRLLIGGYAFTTVGSIALALAEATQSFGWVAAALALIGVGAGVGISAAGAAAVAAVDQKHASLAGGLAFMFHGGFGAFGVAASTLIVTLTGTNLLTDGLDRLGIEPQGDRAPSALRTLARQIEAGGSLPADLSTSQMARIDDLLSASLISGLQNALWFCAALAAIGIVLAWFVREPNADTTTR